MSNQITYTCLSLK